MVRCEWLGAPRILCDNQNVHIERRKALGILIYLTVRTVPATREDLKTLFWPETDPTGAGRSLRSALSEIRKKLPDIIETGANDVLVVNQGELNTDIEEFKSLVARSRDISDHPEAAEDLEQAAVLWRGSFLQGLEIRASYRFDDWMLLLTESLKSELFEILEPLVEYRLATGNTAAARSALAIWLDADPLDEKAHRLMIRTCLKRGGRTEALRHYKKFATDLEKELGFPPSPETERLVQEIHNSGSAGGPGFQLSFRKTYKLAGRPDRPREAAGDGLHPESILSECLRDSFSGMKEIQYIDPVNFDEDNNSGYDDAMVGRKLGTPHILNGSFDRTTPHNATLRMNLTDALNGQNIWNRSSPVAAHDIPELAREVAGEILRTLTGEQAARVSGKAEQPQCHAWRMQGIHLRRYGKVTDLKQSILCFEEALRADPNSLRAEAEMGFSFAISGAHGVWQLPIDEAYGRAREISDAVLLRDPYEPMALLTRGTIEHEYDLKPELGLETARRALEREPDDPEILILIAQILQSLWRREDALEVARLAYNKDPGSGFSLITLHSQLRSTKRYRESFDIVDRFESLFPRNPLGSIIRGTTHAHMGDYRRAVETMRPLLSENPEDTMLPFIGNLGYSLGRLGRTGEAESLLERLNKHYAANRVKPYAIALTYLGLSRIPESLDWLERAAAEMHFGTTGITFNSEWDELLPMPRFREICGNLGVSEFPSDGLTASSDRKSSI